MESVRCVVSGTLDDSARLSERTTQSSMFPFLFALALGSPFSKSESGTVPDPFLNSSFSSVAGDLFRLSDHFPYRYSAPNNTEMADQQKKQLMDGAWTNRKERLQRPL